MVKYNSLRLNERGSDVETISTWSNGLNPSEDSMIKLWTMLDKHLNLDTNTKQFTRPKNIAKKVKVDDSPLGVLSTCLSSIITSGLSNCQTDESLS